MTRGPGLAEPAEATDLPPSAGLGLRLAIALALGVADAGRVLRDFAAYLPTQVIPAIVGFLVLPILARKLAPTELGVLALAQTLITLGWIAVASWLAAAIVRELPAYRERGDLAGFRRTLVRGLAAVGLGLVVFAALVATGGVLSSAIGDNAVLIVAATAGLVAENLAAALFTASFRPRAYAVLELAARVGSIGLGTVLVFEGHNVSGYLFGLASGSLAIGVIGLAAAWPRDAGRVPGPRPDVGRWLHYGVPASMAAIVGWGLSFLDRYVLAALKDAGEVGIYTVGSVLGDKIVMVPMYAFFMAATPLLMTAFERHGHAEVERLMASYTRLILLFGIPCIAVIGIAADELVPFLAGDPYKDYYAPAATIAPIVAVGSLLFAITAIASVPLSVARRTRPLVYSSATGLAANLAANAVLIPPLGAKGAAIATPIGWGVYLLAVQLWARSAGRWRFPWLTLARAALAAGAAYAVAVVAVPDTSTDVAAAFAETAVIVVVYVLALAVTGELRGAHPRTQPASPPLQPPS